MGDKVNQNFHNKYIYNKAIEFKNEGAEQTHIYPTIEFEKGIDTFPPLITTPTTLPTTSTTTTTTTTTTTPPTTTTLTTATLTKTPIPSSDTSTLLSGASVSKRLREASIPISVNELLDVIVDQEKVTEEKNRVIEEKEREIERMREAMENQRRELERDLQNQREENERLAFNIRKLTMKEHANKGLTITFKERPVYYVFDKPNIAQHYKFFIKWLDEFFSSAKMDLKEMSISEERSNFPPSIEKREKHNNNDNLLPLVLYIITPASIRIEHEMNMKKYNDISLKTQSIVLFVLRYGLNKSAFPIVELPPNLTTGINTHPEISNYAFPKHGFLSAIFCDDMIVDSEDCMRDLESLLGIRQRRICGVM